MLIKKSLLVELPAKCLFDLVNDIESYPEFIHWCSKTQLLYKDEHSLKARIFIKYTALNFSTINKMEDTTKITIVLDEGPFKYLNATWQFIAMREDACKVIFEIDFAYKNFLIEKMLSPILNLALADMLQTFYTRAISLYKK